MEQNLINPYKQGADDGVLLGVILSALFFTSAYSIETPGLGLLSLVIMAAVPVVIFFMLRRTWLRDNYKTQFAGLWMQGIMTFICGGLISSAVAYCYLRWVDPTWLTRQVEAMIELYSSVDGDSAEQMVNILQTSLNQNLLPSNIDMSINVFWLEVFTGSMLTLFVALFVRLLNKPPMTPPSRPTPPTSNS